MIDEIVKIDVRDGTSIVARVHRPDGAGPYPALLGAAPYRFDNNSLPASAQFLWRETGPIEWYVEQGYAYVHMDVRGSGRSGGQFEFIGRREQGDPYDGSDGSADSPGAITKLAASGSHISACCNGLWVRSLRHRSRALPPMTDWRTFTVAALITAASPATSFQVTGGIRTVLSTVSRPAARHASRKPT